jgi:hypothetical protein
MGALYGSPSRGESQSLGIGLDNQFQYKALKDGKEVKGDLFSLNLRTAHDFARDSLKWSDLGSSVLISPLKSGGGALRSLSGLSLQLGASHSFYDFDADGRKINRSPPGFLRLVSFDLSSSFRLRGGGERRAADSLQIGDGEGDTEWGAAASQTTPVEEYQPAQAADRFDNPVWQPSPMPWEAGVAFHYGERHDPVWGTSKVIWSSLNMELNATRHWKVGYDTRVDLHSRQVVFTNLSLYRDMHCWEGRLTWSPMRGNASFYLIISVKSPQLRDVKVEKQKGTGGFWGS